MKRAGGFNFGESYLNHCSFIFPSSPLFSRSARAALTAVMNAVSLRFMARAFPEPVISCSKAILIFPVKSLCST